MKREDESFDFREGGRETLVSIFGDGTRFGYYATYTDIVPGERIVYTYEMSMNGQRISVSVATVEIRAAAAGAPTWSSPSRASTSTGWTTRPSAGRAPRTCSPPSAPRSDVSGSLAVTRAPHPLRPAPALGGRAAGGALDDAGQRRDTSACRSSTSMWPAPGRTVSSVPGSAPAIERAHGGG